MKRISISISDEDYRILQESGFDLSALIHRELQGHKELCEQIKRYDRQQITDDPDHAFKIVNAVYTGGNIWLFYGDLNSQDYFLTDDDGNTLILDASPENFDESLEVEWQNAHKVKELFDNERIRFCNALADRFLRHNSIDDFGGITDDEIRAYKKHWALPM